MISLIILTSCRSFEETGTREERSFDDLPNIGLPGFGQFDQNGQNFRGQDQFQEKEEFRSQSGEDGEP